MPLIHRLNPVVYNQIAAGEVIQRPSSVIRELIENSLDSGCDEVKVILEDGGKKLIEVLDNGDGILKEDLALAVEAHCTSKLKALVDLDSIQTLGFRGEALASINSISKLFIYSQKVDCDYGWEFNSDRAMKPISMPKGTRIRVENLFYNVPARKSFLRNHMVEYKHCLQVFKNYCLAYFDISWNLVHNGKQVINLNKATSDDEKRKRIDKLFNNTEHMVFFKENDINGWVGLPDYAKPRKDLQLIFLNGRPIKDKIITKAINTAYKDLIHSDRYPFYIIYLNIHNKDVDINVHPTKSEVIFKNPNSIFDKVFHLVARALHKSNNLKRDFLETNNNIGYKDNKNIQSSGVVTKPFIKNRETNKGIKKFDLDINKNLLKMYKNIDGNSNTENLFNNKENENNKKNLLDENKKVDLGNAIAQIGNNYILAESRNGLIIVDMHAAHERILFEKLKIGWNKGEIKVQYLLCNLDVKINIDDFVVLKKYKDDIQALGWYFDKLDDNTISIKAVPMILKNVDLEVLFLSIIDNINSYGKTSNNLFKDKIDEILSSISCHSAVRFNDILNLDEMNNILKNMEKTDYFSYCNHGRPTWFLLSFDDLEFRFKRGK